MVAKFAALMANVDNAFLAMHCKKQVDVILATGTRQGVYSVRSTSALNVMKTT